MPTQAQSDLVKEIRDNLKFVKDSDNENRVSYRSNQSFLAGDQWEPGEAEKRRNKRLMITTDLLNAPVDQIVNSVRQNKPGPSVSPSGEGTDKEDAQIFEGILRRIDYENRSWIAIEQAFENATGGNFGCWYMDLEYEKGRSFNRVIKVGGIPNANETIYFDPNALEKDRSDAMWAVEVKSYSRSEFKRKFSNSRINKMGSISSLADFFGISNLDPALSGWVTKDTVQVVKYWKIEVENDTLREYSDHINRWDSEDVPPDVHVMADGRVREDEHRKTRWYISDGLDILKDGDWEGDSIPLFPVYGKEKYVRNKRLLFSMIQLAKQAQQAFNYAFTGACEVLAISSKAPYLGLLGQFRSKFKQWQQANTDPQAYLEFDEVPLANGQVYTTPPIRNLSEPPVQAFLAFCQLCINAVQRATSVFDPSLGKQKSDQSGVAIKELQQESTQGNFHWSDNLTITLTHYYRAMLDMVQKEYDAPQVTTILRADGTPMQVRINQDFKSGVDADGKDIIKHYKIAQGKFAVTVNVGPSYDSQMQANENKLTGLIKVLPPQLVAQAADIFIKLQNYGPLGDQLAERLTPQQFRDPKDPNAAAQHLAEVMQQNEQLMAVVQKLQMAIATKQPELEVRKWIAAVQAIANIEAAKVKAGDNQADREQDLIQHSIDLAHEAGSDEADRTHDLNMQQGDQDHDENMQQQQQAHEGSQNMQDREAAAAKEPVESGV